MKNKFLVSPNPDNPALSTQIAGIDHNGQPVTTDVVTERPLTLYLNAQEVVTMMTIGDQPDRPSQEGQFLLVTWLPTNYLHLQFVLLGHYIPQPDEVVVLAGNEEVIHMSDYADVANWVDKYTSRDIALDEA